MRSYNAAIPALVQTRTSAGKHIVVVDSTRSITANANYKTAWLDDNLHPNDAGYVVMGRPGTLASNVPAQQPDRGLQCPPASAQRDPTHLGARIEVARGRSNSPNLASWGS